MERTQQPPRTAQATAIPGLEVITCQGKGCGTRIFMSDCEPSRRLAKQRIRDAGWELHSNGGICPSCK